MDNPCRDCKSRSATCHAECGLYADFADRQERARKERRIREHAESALKSMEITRETRRR